MVERPALSYSNKSELLSTSIRDQQKYLNEWLQTDSSLVGQVIVNQNFSPDSEINLYNWKTKIFYEEGDYDFHCKILGSWHELVPENYEEGLMLKGKLLQMPCKISLRALAIDIKIRLRLSFHSSFYLFLRVVDGLSPETPVLKILKDTNLRGLFFVFANIDPLNNKFKFIKQNQIPEILGESEEESKELEIGIIDNGNDQVYVNVSGVGKSRCVKLTNFVCSGFVPEIRDVALWMAGTGDGVCVKSVSVQYRNRIQPKSISKKSPDCVCTIN